MTKTPKQQLEYYRQHPPSCLSGRDVRPADLPDVGFDGHGFTGKFPDELVEVLNVIFQVHCPCGGENFFLVAEAVSHEIFFDSEQVYADHYYLTCDNCGKKMDLSDVGHYGYDYEILKAEPSRYQAVRDPDFRPKGPEQVMVACRECGSHVQRVYTRFEYSADLFDSVDFAERAEDFFSWYTLLCACSKCSTVGNVADFECA